MKECIEKILDWMEENTPLKNYGEFLPAVCNFLSQILVTFHS